MTFSRSPEWIKAKYGAWITGGVISAVIVIDCHCQSCWAHPAENEHSHCLFQFSPAFVLCTCHHQKLEWITRGMRPVTSPDSAHESHEIPSPFSQMCSTGRRIFTLAGLCLYSAATFVSTVKWSAVCQTDLAHHLQKKKRELHHS